MPVQVDGYAEFRDVLIEEHGSHILRHLVQAEVRALNGGLTKYSGSLHNAGFVVHAVDSSGELTAVFRGQEYVWTPEITDDKIDDRTRLWAKEAGYDIEVKQC